MKGTRAGERPSLIEVDDENPVLKAHSNHCNRWWTGGAFGGLPLDKARDPFSDARCQPADRRRVAEPLGFTLPLHTGPVCRTPRFSVSGSGRRISHEAGDG